MAFPQGEFFHVCQDLTVGKKFSHICYMKKVFHLHESLYGRLEYFYGQSFFHKCHMKRAFHLCEFLCELTNHSYFYISVHKCHISKVFSFQFWKPCCFVDTLFTTVYIQQVGLGASNPITNHTTSQAYHKLPRYPASL